MPGTRNEQWLLEVGVVKRILRFRIMLPAFCIRNRQKCIDECMITYIIKAMPSLH